MLPYNTHKLLESYLYDRKLAVRCNTAITDDFTIGAGVYVLYTAGIPTSTNNKTQATAHLTLHLVDVEKWLSDWRTKVNEPKCKHVTFTLNRQSCPPLTLNNTLFPQANEMAYLGVHLYR